MDRDTAVDQLWRLLGGGPRPARLAWSGPAGTLPAPLPVATLAQATVGACALAAADLRAAQGRPIAVVPVNHGAVAAAFVSERLLRHDGAPVDGFAPLSRFWPTADGWVRTHANYPHHRARLLDLLGVDSPDAVGPALARRPASDWEDAAAPAGALVVAVRDEAQWSAHPQGAAVAAQPLLTLERSDDAPPVAAPQRPRVLDLTRVIAGPVATRTLALVGADVLRIDPPGLPELAGQHLDTGFGKRSTLLDLARPADRRSFDDLLATADAVVTGYRPTALDRLGLSAAALRARRPGLVVAQLSAWGWTGPWAGRRGFDSLVQAASGISLRCGTGGSPGALPAQALDHGTGYLLAAAVLRALARRATGGGALARLSLAGTAHWLQHALTPTPSSAPEPDLAPWCTTQDGLRYARPPVHLPGEPDTWAHPPVPWGSSAPRWLG